MALELESAIMGEIGFHSPPNWYAGSGSCVPIRENAAKRLPGVITKYNTAGQKIVPPQASLIALVARAAQILDRSEFSLDKTWKVASDVIQAHILFAHVPNDKLAEKVTQTEAAILEVYFGESGIKNSYPWNETNMQLVRPSNEEE
ncbi:MAG: hypothetical protein HY438_01305 [DPANN group archaeon]|nr:hypothetical protein [DPANN group archaeon]